MAVKGWKATGLLQPLWNSYEGGRKDMARRDALAKAVGTTGSVLSTINSGNRNLGHDLGRRLAAELRVTIFDLGAPEEAAETRQEHRVIDRLREAEALLNRLVPRTDDLASRVVALEKQAPSRRRRGGSSG